MITLFARWWFAVLTASANGSLPALNTFFSLIDTLAFSPCSRWQRSIRRVKRFHPLGIVSLLLGSPLSSYQGRVHHGHAWWHTGWHGRIHSRWHHHHGHEHDQSHTVGILLIKVGLVPMHGWSSMMYTWQMLSSIIIYHFNILRQPRGCTVMSCKL